MLMHIHMLTCLIPHFSSTHNTRIERLWVEVGRNFCRSWRAFFSRLEDQFGLDCSRPSHIWLLQVLFLNDINADCDSFVQEWNSHPISGHDTNDMSPQVYFSDLICLHASKTGTGFTFSATNPAGSL